MIIRKLKPNSLVTVVELAELFNVSVRTVQRFAQFGVLPEPQGKDKNANLYRLDECVQAYTWYLIDKAMGSKTPC